MLRQHPLPQKKKGDKEPLMREEGNMLWTGSPSPACGPCATEERGASGWTGRTSTVGPRFPPFL